MILTAIAIGLYLYSPIVPRKAVQEISNEEELLKFPEHIVVFSREKGVAAGEANRIFADEKFTLGIRVEKLPDPKKEKYEGWLWDMKENKWIYIGPLVKADEGTYRGDYVLGYQTREDLRRYKNLVITLETVDDQNPEKEVAGAAFP